MMDNRLYVALVQEAIDDMIARGRGSGDGLPGKPEFG